MTSETRWLERAVDALDVALVLVDTERTVVFANAAAHRLFGVTRGALIGCSVERLIAAERRGELRNLEDVLAGGGARKVRSALRREDGARVDVTMVIEPCLGDRHEVSGVSIRYYDPPQTSVRPVHTTPKPPLGMNDPLPATPISASVLPSAPAQSPYVSEAMSGSSRRSVRPSGNSVRTRLHQLARNLQWLQEQASAPGVAQPGEEARERMRALLVISESLAVVDEALAELPNDEDIPPAPRMPRV